MRLFFFSSRRRHTRCGRDWSSDVCSSDLNIKKVGFGLTNDRKILKAKFGIRLENTEELSTKVKRFAGVKENVGARAAVAMFFQQRLSKGAQTSNWAKFPLQEHQIKYAADDAYAALCIAKKLEELMKQRLMSESAPEYTKKKNQ